MIYLDVDDFKSFNDTQGHRSGDEVLRAVAKAIKEITRAEDYCFRYGGDEFCIIMPNCREEQARDNFITRFNQKIKLSLNNISLSFGIIDTGPYEYEEANSLIHKADQRMYSYKRASKQQQQTMAAANDLAPENSTADVHSISQSQSVDKAVE